MAESDGDRIARVKRVYNPKLSKLYKRATKLKSAGAQRQIKIAQMDVIRGRESEVKSAIGSIESLLKAAEKAAKEAKKNNN